MSMNFTPTAGTWIASIYYSSDEADGTSVKNGVYASQDEQPSVHCHNGGAYLLQDAMGLEPDYCGEVKAENVQAAHDALLAYLKRHQCDYLTSKLDALDALFLHCKYHACGFTFG